MKSYQLSKTHDRYIKNGKNNLINNNYLLEKLHYKM